jgi:DNA-binding NarL/FixJ family response regulator
VSTVNFHVHNVLDKLGAKTRTEAVVLAAREGLIDV